MIFANIFMLNILLFMFFLGVVHIEVTFLSLLLSSHEWIDWYIFFTFDLELVVQSNLRILRVLLA